MSGLDDLPEYVVADRPKPDRMEIILQYVNMAWQKHPDMRLGQLLGHLASQTDDLDAPSVWDLPDEKIIPAVRKMLKAVVETPGLNS